MGIGKIIHKGIIYGSFVISVGCLGYNVYDILENKSNNLELAQISCIPLLCGAFYTSIHGIIKKGRKNKLEADLSQ